MTACAAVTWPVAAVLMAAIVAGTVLICFAGWASVRQVGR